MHFLPGEKQQEDRDLGLDGRDPRLVVSPAPRRKEPRPGAVALRQRAGREDADRDDGEDDDCGDLLGKVTEKQEAEVYIGTKVS